MHDVRTRRGFVSVRCSCVGRCDDGAVMVGWLVGSFSADIATYLSNMHGGGGGDREEQVLNDAGPKETNKEAYTQTASN